MQHEAGGNEDACVRANRLAFLVDAESYFANLADALERAQEQIVIVGWDLHTEVRLRRDGREPATLGAVLLAAVRRHPRLQVHILLWDYALIYVFERQPLPLFSFVWLSHPRIHVRHDATAPTGASHHQKLVVVDESVAFVGGIDLTLNRWDTREHRARDERRREQGTSHAPFHDVQLLFDGDAVGAVTSVVRARWHRATGRPLPTVTEPGDPWPSGLAPDVERARVQLATTGATPRDGHPTEIERSFVDAINGAKRWLYVENQYLTSATIGDALEASLRAPEGPEIVLVLPRDASGWLEQSTMDVLRTRVLQRLRAADTHERLRVYHPVVSDEENDAVPVYVHAKVLIVDDLIARVGSANLSNRSMGFDTECDALVFGHGEPASRRAIAALMTSLLAEHLGCEPDTVAERLATSGSLVQTIESLRGTGRSLVPGVNMAPAWMLEAVPERTLVDPERPLDLGRWIEEGLPRVVRRETQVSLRAVGALAAAGVGGVIAFYASGAGGLMIASETQPGFAIALLGLYCVSVVLPLPISLLHVGAVLVAGPLAGAGLAALGAALNAGLAFWAGRRLGRDAARRWAGRKLNLLARRLAQRGATCVAVVRALPIGSFSAEGLVAGAGGVRIGDYVLGTVLGLLPNLVLTVLVVSVLGHAITSPGPASIGLAVAVLAGVGVLALIVARWLNAPRRLRS